MNPSSTIHPFEVLLVEDSDADVLMTREALEHDKMLVNLHVVGDGIEALDFLRREGPYAAAPRPSLILLDLNLPRMDGREVLAEIKGDADLRSIPVGDLDHIQRRGGHLPRLWAQRQLLRHEARGLRVRRQDGALDRGVLVHRRDLAGPRE